VRTLLLGSARVAVCACISLVTQDPGAVGTAVRGRPARDSFPGAASGRSDRALASRWASALRMQEQWRRTHGEATLKGLMAAESRRASRDDHTSHSWGIMSLNVSPLYLTAVGRNHSKEKGRPNVSLSRCSVERFCCGT